MFFDKINDFKQKKKYHYLILKYKTRNTVICHFFLHIKLIGLKLIKNIFVCLEELKKKTIKLLHLDRYGIWEKKLWYLVS